ncbi:MAG: hypothetical protein ACK5II_06900 [Paracoccus sp. (in: a-proteobacteria)]
MNRLLANCVDLTDGWYGLGWVEPPDYDPSELIRPVIDPGPAMDALYIWQDISSPFFDYHGQTIVICDRSGEPMQLGLAA